MTKYKTDVKGLTLVPGSGGCFEVSLNGDLIYSKLQTKEYPTSGQIIDAIAAG